MKTRQVLSPGLTALIAVVLLATPACRVLRELGLGGDDPEWRSVTASGLTRKDVLGIAETEVSKEYKVQAVDDFSGLLETEWNYGQYSATTHQDVRQRVLVEVHSQGDGLVELRLRVQQEINHEPGRHIGEEHGEWGAHDDDLTRTAILIIRIRHVLDQIGGLEDADASSSESSSAS